MLSPDSEAIWGRSKGRSEVQRPLGVSVLALSSLLKGTRICLSACLASVSFKVNREWPLSGFYTFKVVGKLHMIWTIDIIYLKDLSFA